MANGVKVEFGAVNEAEVELWRGVSRASLLSPRPGAHLRRHK